MTVVDWEFIETLEGPRKRAGYVPDDDDGEDQAGVTIASGVDLGYRDTEWLWYSGLDAETIQALAPYMGLSGKVAKRALEEIPLLVSEEQAAAIDQTVRAEFISRISRKYDQDLERAALQGQWAFLPRAQQTVIMSVSWQYGTPWVKTPMFWSQALRRDWNAMLRNLNDFRDGFPTRRRKEAAYLKNNM